MNHSASIEKNHLEQERIQREKSAKMLLWIAIVSMIMLFIGFTSGYIVSMAQSDWLSFELPQTFYFSTAAILLSSLSMNWALVSARKDNLANIKLALITTLLLGLVFVYLQFVSWGKLMDKGIFFTGGNVSGSYLYVLSGVHLLHLAGGIISLVVVTAKAFRGSYHSSNMLGLRLCATYWHFLDILWVYLFLFLLFIR